MSTTSSTHVLIDRRPTKLRDLALLKCTVKRLISADISPNLISILGMFACIGSGSGSGSALAATALTEGLIQRLLWLTGAVLLQMRGLANLLDGMVAVDSGKSSPVGELYNDVPDRVSDTAMLIGLGYSVSSAPTLGFVATCTGNACRLRSCDGKGVRCTVGLLWPDG